MFQKTSSKPPDFTHWSLGSVRPGALLARLFRLASRSAALLFLVGPGVSPEKPSRAGQDWFSWIWANVREDSTGRLERSSRAAMAVG